MVSISKGRHVFLAEAKPFGMGRVQEVLLVLQVFRRCGPLAAPTPFPGGAGCGGQGLCAGVVLPQPGMGHTVCSTGPVSVEERADGRRGENTLKLNYQVLIY